VLDALQEQLQTIKTDIDRAMAATKVDCSRMGKIFATPKAKAKAKAKGKKGHTVEEVSSEVSTPGSPTSL
jgi:hypothetical protein